MTDENDHVFDPVTTPCRWLGIVPETFWRLPGVVRSSESASIRRRLARGRAGAGDVGGSGSRAAASGNRRSHARPLVAISGIMAGRRLNAPEEKMRAALARLPAFAALMLILSACSGGGGTPEGAIEGYLESLVAGDPVEVINLSCVAWEEQAATEAASFESVEVTLEGLACQQAGSEDEAALVTCSGTIHAIYDGEQQDLSLEGRTYRAVQEDGEWKMCGYQQGE